MLLVNRRRRDPRGRPAEVRPSEVRPGKVGPGKRDGRWHEIVPGTSYLLRREFFGDWGTAEPSVLQIECTDELVAPWPKQRS